MQTFLRILTGVLFVLFIGAVMVAFAPQAPAFLTAQLSRIGGGGGGSGASHLTVEAPEAAPGTATERRLSDLTRDGISGGVCETGEIEGAVRITVPVGFASREAWVLDGGDGSEPRPTIVLFHGAGRPATSMIDMWQQTARENDLILVSLQAATPHWPLDTAEPAVIHAMLDLVEQDVPIDRTRVFLFGHSSGAGHAQVVANQVVGPWQAVAVHAGYPHLRRIHRIEDAPPARHYLGSADGIFNLADARTVNDSMAYMGHEAELHVIPVHGHWFYDIGPSIADDAWAWFAEF